MFLFMVVPSTFAVAERSVSQNLLFATEKAQIVKAELRQAKEDTGIKNRVMNRTSRLYST